ncbi:hypothetical protein HAX54_046730 [Datura stramonium]|uniref:FAD/NAD(P)-binding domain-containing protein n=1 Tax=Datura stramonium TaxID=4076 RepID=A0ABS8SRS3_DATST|nr:hypothetical protein [Datura stramonium]
MDIGAYDYLVTTTGHYDPLPVTRTDELEEYQARLLEFIGPKASDKTLGWLKSKNVEVKLMQSVDLSNNTSSGNRTYFTSTGETIRADCHFLCTGKPPGSTWLRDTYLNDRIDNFGRLKELKQKGYSAQQHALVAAKNLKLLMSGGKENKLATYEPRSSPKIIVSLGRQDAVAQFPFTTIIGLVQGMIKSKDLYVGKTRKKMGLHPKY